jgi:hypothetical protein
MVRSESFEVINYHSCIVSACLGSLDLEVGTRREYEIDLNLKLSCLVQVRKVISRVEGDVGVGQP